MKQIAVLTFHNETIELLIAFLNRNQINVLYHKEYQGSDEAFKDGTISSFSKAHELLQKIIQVDDQIAYLKGKIKDIYLILPFFNYQVLHVKEEVGILNDETVGPTESKAILQNLRRRKIDPSLEFIEISPYRFSIDDNKLFSVFPLKQKGVKLCCNAFLYPYPKQIIEDYQKLFSLLEISVKRILPPEICATHYVSKVGNLSSMYVLMMVDEDETSLAFVSFNQVVSMTTIKRGWKHFVKILATKFSVTFEVMRQHLTTFGYSKLDSLTGVTLFTNPQGQSFTQEQLNHEIKAALNDLKLEFLINIKRLIPMKNNAPLKELSELPLIMIGEFNDLQGKENFFKEFLHVTFLTSNIIGATKSTAIPALGLIWMTSEFSGTYSELSEDSIKLTRNK
ncbi:MAG: hypothetical protein LBR37_00365 [Erysipelotrichaceae bacterium]|jgi:DNA integrity scanning protein DisA with diadenylate cyclase activity|nr:hypothetical protein [Erysipelotrichaceae bacterium]